MWNTVPEQELIRRW